MEQEDDYHPWSSTRERQSDNASCSATISSSPRGPMLAGECGHVMIHVMIHVCCRLHLVDGVGRISLAEVTLVEDPSDEERNDEGGRNTINYN